MLFTKNTPEDFRNRNYRNRFAHIPDRGDLLMPISPDPMQYGNTSFVHTIYIVLREYICWRWCPAIYLHISETVRCLWCVLNINFFRGGGYRQNHHLKYGQNNRGFFLFDNSSKQICMLNKSFQNKHLCGRKSYCKSEHSDIKHLTRIFTEYPCQFPY